VRKNQQKRVSQANPPASPVCYLDSPEVDPAYLWAQRDKEPLTPPSPRSRGAREQKAAKAGQASPRPRRGRGPAPD
jgi:hypothetical protein